MRIPRIAFATPALSVLALVTFDAACGQKRLDNVPASSVSASESSHRVRLKLVDGSFIVADEASESEQGVWYRKGGISHLISRERVKGVERGANSPKTGAQVAKVTLNDDPIPAQGFSDSGDRSVWIYLIGGARVEADNVTESAAGVWYRRGPLSIFIE